MVVGTPSAVPEDEPKLLRMSLRTTPLSVRTFGPLDPSAGKGPAVSSGITSTSPVAAPVVAAVVAEVAPVEAAVVPEVPVVPVVPEPAVVPEPLSFEDAEPTRASRPAPPRTCRARRRPIRRGRS